MGQRIDALMRAIPGFRSGTRWKQIVAGVVYLVAFFLALSGWWSVGLCVFGAAALVAGLRRRVPLLSSPSRVEIAAGYAVLIALGVFLGTINYVQVRGRPRPASAGSAAASTQTLAPSATTAPAAAGPPPPATATIVPPTPVPATPVSPTRTPVPPTPVPPSPTPVPPAATPVPIAAFSGTFTPRVVSVGSKQVFAFQVTNAGDTDIDGIHVTSSGPWGKYTVTALSPTGTFDSVFGVQIFRWPLKVRPGQTVSLNIAASPNEPGNYDFSFRLRDSADHLLKTISGDDAALGGQVAATR